MLRPGLLSLTQVATLTGIEKQTLRRRLRGLDERLRSAGQDGCLIRFNEKRGKVYVAMSVLRQAAPDLLNAEAPADEGKVDKLLEDVSAIRKQIDWLAQIVTERMVKG